MLQNCVIRHKRLYPDWIRDAACSTQAPPSTAETLRAIAVAHLPLAARCQAFRDKNKKGLHIARHLSPYASPFIQACFRSSHCFSVSTSLPDASSREAVPSLFTLYLVTFPMASRILRSVLPSGQAIIVESMSPNFSEASSPFPCE